MEKSSPRRRASAISSSFSTFLVAGSTGRFVGFLGTVLALRAGLRGRWVASLGVGLLDESLLLHEAGEPLLQVGEGLVQRPVLGLLLPDGPALVQGTHERAVEAVDAELHPAVARGPAGDRRVQARQRRSVALAPLAGVHACPRDARPPIVAIVRDAVAQGKTIDCTISPGWGVTLSGSGITPLHRSSAVMATATEESTRARPSSSRSDSGRTPPPGRRRQRGVDGGGPQPTRSAAPWSIRPAPNSGWRANEGPPRRPRRRRARPRVRRRQWRPRRRRKPGGHHRLEQVDFRGAMARAEPEGERGGGQPGVVGGGERGHDQRLGVLQGQAGTGPARRSTSTGASGVETSVVESLPSRTPQPSNGRHRASDKAATTVSAGQGSAKSWWTRWKLGSMI